MTAIKKAVGVKVTVKYAGIEQARGTTVGATPPAPCAKKYRVGGIGKYRMARIFGRIRGA